MSDIQNPFLLLDMKSTYRIDLDELTEKYISKQREYHPDMHVTSSPQEKLKASSMAVALNHAFEILKDPFQRGLSLLHLKGVEVDTHENESNPQILIQTLDDQEHLEHISNGDELEKFSSECDNRHKDLENNLEQAFEINNNELALRHLKSLKYLLKLKMDVDRKRRFLR